MKQTFFDQNATPPQSHSSSLEKRDFLTFLNKKQSEHQMKRNYLIRPGTASLQKSSRFYEPRLLSAQSKTLVPLFPIANNDSWISSRGFPQQSSSQINRSQHGSSSKMKNARYNFPTTSGGKGEPLQAETLYDELKQLKLAYNITREENNRMKARISNLEKESMNYQKIIEEIEKNGIVKTQITKASGPDTLAVALKKNIKDLKTQIKQQLEEISFMKKNVKQTRVQELEIERKCFSEENIRLKNLLNQNYMNNYSNFMKEQDFANLEQKFYEQNNFFEALSKEKEDLIASLKLSEENIQKLKDIMSFSENNNQKNLNRMKKKVNEKEIEIKYLNNEKNMLINEKRAGLQQNNANEQSSSKELVILNLKKSLEISEKNSQALNEEIASLKQELESLKSHHLKQPLNLMRLSFKSSSRPNPKDHPKQEIEGFFDELKAELILKNIPHTSLENTFFENLKSQLILTKNDVLSFLAFISPFQIRSGIYLEKIGGFILQNSSSLKLSDIFFVLKLAIGEYGLNRLESFADLTLKEIDKKKAALIGEMQDFFSKNGFLTKSFIENKMKENGIQMTGQEVEEFLVEFVDYKKTNEIVNFAEFLEAVITRKDLNLNRKTENSHSVLESPGLEHQKSPMITDNPSYHEEEFEEDHHD